MAGSPTRSGIDPFFASLPFSITLLDRWRQEDAAAAAAGVPPEEPLEITRLSLREVKLD
jgi:hypothetical protein